MLMTLFDEEQIIKNHDAALTRRVTDKVTKKVTKENHIASVRNLMKTLKLTSEQAMDALMIPASERAALIEML